MLQQRFFCHPVLVCGIYFCVHVHAAWLVLFVYLPELVFVWGLFVDFVMIIFVFDLIWLYLSFAQFFLVFVLECTRFYNICYF